MTHWAYKKLSPRDLHKALSVDVCSLVYHIVCTVHSACAQGGIMSITKKARSHMAAVGECEKNHVAVA